MQLNTFKVVLYWPVINSPIQQRMKQTGFPSLYSEINRYYIHLKHLTVKKTSFQLTFQKHELMSGKDEIVFYSEVLFTSMTACWSNALLLAICKKVTILNIFMYPPGGQSSIPEASKKNPMEQYYKRSYVKSS